MTGMTRRVRWRIKILLIVGYVPTYGRLYGGRLGSQTGGGTLIGGKSWVCLENVGIVCLGLEKCGYRLS